jgi:hypothetical protein
MIVEIENSRAGGGGNGDGNITIVQNHDSASLINKKSLKFRSYNIIA